MTSVGENQPLATMGPEKKMKLTGLTCHGSHPREEEYPFLDVANQIDSIRSDRGEGRGVGERCEPLFPRPSDAR